MSVRSLRLAVAVLSLFTLPLMADSFDVFTNGNWSNNATWYQNGVPATRYPGSLAGTVDTVTTTPSTYTVTVDVALAENVTMTTTCPSNTSTCVIDVTTGGLLKLTGASSIGADAKLQLSGGTVLNAGMLSLAGTAKLDWVSGTLGGGGSTNASAGSNVNVVGPGNAVLDGGQTLSLFGTLTYTAGQFYQNGGADVVVKSGGLFDIQTINGIATDNGITATLTVDAGGMLKKSGGAFGTNVDPMLFNNGTVRVDVASLVFSRGTHTGTFVMTNAANAIIFGFPGTHTFNGTSTISGAGEAFFGGAVSVPGTLGISNMENDGFASFTGTGTINLSGTWTWRGATVTNLTINASNTATVNITGENNVTLTANAHLNNQGTLDLNPGAGALTLNSGGHITNDGDFNLLGDVTIFSNALSGARIDNLATRSIDKTSGASIATVNAVVNNSGNVNVTSGGLKLTRGGNHTGTWFTGSTSAIEFAGNTNQFLGGTITGTGTFGLSGGVMDVDANLSVPAAVTFKQSGGVLTGAGNLTIDGTFFWTGGTMDNSSGNGQTIATAAPMIQIAPATGPVTLSGRTFVNLGTVTYTATTPNFLNIDDGGILLNDGSFNIAGDSQINTNNVSSPRFVNNAGLGKTAGAGNAQVFVYVQNDGGLAVTSGTLTLSGGGQSSGTIDVIGATSKLIIDNSVFGITAATNITTSGWLVVSGASARLALVAPLTVENLELLSGQIDSGGLTVNTQMIWKAGQLGPGGSTTLSSATLDHSAPAGPTTIDSHSVNLNSSTYTYNGTTFPLTLTNNSTVNVNNGSAFNSTGDGSVNSGAGSNNFNLASGAFLRKNGGTSGTRFDVAVHNSGGTVSSEVNGQSLILNGGGSMTGGQLQATGTALFDFFGGTFTHSGGAYGGTGTFRVLGSGTLKFTASALPTPPFELHTGGTIDVQPPSVVAFDTLQWKGGTITGAGQKRVMVSGAITNAGPSNLTGGLFDINGPVTYSGDNTNFLTLGGGTTFLIGTGGTLDITTDGRIAGPGLLQNQGSLQKSAGGGTSAINAPLASAASGIDVVTGKLQFGGGGTISSTSIDIGSAQLEFAGGTMTIGTATTLSGTGTVRFSGGITNIDIPLTLPNAAIEGGTLGGSGNVTIDGGFWSSGTMNGSGTTIVGAGKTFNVTGAGTTTLDRAFTNDGTLRFNTAPVVLGGTGSLTNTSVVQIQQNTTITLPVTNNGSVGTGATAATLNGGVSGNGTWTVVPTSLLSILGPTSITGGSFTGGGAVRFGGSPSSIEANVNLTGDGQLIVHGDANFNNNSVTTAAFEMRGGALGGNSPITITSAPSTPTTWKAGTIGGTGAFTIASPTIFTIDGSLGAMTLDGRTITNGGSIHYTATNPLTFANGAAIVNNGSFTIHNDTALPGTGTFTNNGTFAKNSDAGTTAFGPAFTNTNTVALNSGTVAFNGGFTQSAGKVVLTGGNMGGSSVVINGGELAGTGTVTANVTNNALVMPGLSPGALTISGSYAQTSAGTLQIELAGTTPGTQYDQLNVSGTATLDGTLTVSFIPPYIPNGGETYDVVTFASKSGDFATKNLPTFPAGGSIVASYEPPASPTKLQLTALVTQADMTLSQTPSASGVNHGDTVTFTVTITNNGPATATGISLTDTFMNATFVSASGPMATCSGSGPINCTIGTLAAGQSTTVTITLNASDLGTISNTANVTAVEFDPVTSNNGPNTATIFVGPRADLVITKSGPATTNADGTITYTITIRNDGPSDAANVVVDDPRPTRLSFVSNSGACTTGFPCSLGSMTAGTSKVITSTWHVAAGSEGNTITNTASVTSTTVDTVTSNNTSSTSAYVSCGGNSVPAALQPSGGTVPVTGTLSWTGGSGSYVVYLGAAATGCSTQFAVTNGNSVSYTLEPGTTYQWRVESVLAGCQPASSDCITFTTEGTPNECTVPQAPAPRIVGQTTSAKTYEVEWDAVPGATRYEVDEALGADFANATTSIVNTTRKAYKHDATEPTAFYYRVRAFNDCQTLPSANSAIVRVVIVPLPPKDEPQQEVNVPAGSTETIVQQVFIPGEPNVTLFFNATTDRPWLTVTPPNGALPPQGVTLQVTADPKNLPNGTFTASLIVTITDSARGTATHGTTTTTIPLSINLVTPVSPVQTKPATSEHALIIPSVGHLDGIGSQWRSDIRITNAGFRSARYSLTFTPSGGTAQGVKQTTITVDAGATTALDDVVRNWYGIGSLGDSANGMLEIVPLDDPAATSLATVASSRTYNVTNHGTLGQFIPAIRANALIGKALQGALPQLLSLQQIAQNGAYRTNVGIAEGSGNPASVLLRIFNAAGDKLRDVPLTLAAGEQRQLNSLLATQGIELSDGRVEVQVLDGGGKVTAYASVIDNKTNDPLLVAGTPLAQRGTWHWILPGAANLDNAVAHWRTDMRVFNYGAAPRIAELTFVPAAGSGEKKRVDVNLSPGVVVSFDDVVRSTFGSENVGGAIHLRMDFDANLVVTGRTYNQTVEGTFGQFIPAVTSDDTVGIGDRALQILQVEDSIRYRTNVGITETAGFPTTIEVQVYLPDSKVTPTVTIPLTPFEFRQFNVIRSFGLGNVYNARIAIRVVGGQGRVAAYGSVIDELTQDPTYVPAQK